MSWTSGAAAAYLGGFTPFSGVAGFAQNAKSDLAAETLSALPAMNQAAALQLSRDALSALGQIKASRIAEEGATQRTLLQLEQARRNSRRDNIRMAGSGIAQLAGSFLSAEAPRIDPSQMNAAAAQYDELTRRYNQNRNNGSAATALQGLGLVS